MPLYFSYSIVSGISLFAFFTCCNVKLLDEWKCAFLIRSDLVCVNPVAYTPKAYGALLAFCTLNNVYCVHSTVCTLYIESEYILYLRKLQSVHCRKVKIRENLGRAPVCVCNRKKLFTIMFGIYSLGRYI